MLLQSIRHRTDVSIRRCTFLIPGDFWQKSLRIAFVIAVVVIFDFDIDGRAVGCRSRHRSPYSVVEKGLHAELFNGTGNTITKTHDLDALQVLKSFNVSCTRIRHLVRDLFQKNAIIIFRVNRVLHTQTRRLNGGCTESRGFTIHIALLNPSPHL